MDFPTGHSPLGMSGLERYMVCPGSVGLSHGVMDDEDDEFRGPGKAAHALLEVSLVMDDDAWTRIGHSYADSNRTWYPWGLDAPDDAIAIDKPMADAVQQCLDAVRKWHPDRNQGNFWTEKRYYCPSIHEFFYGTADIVALELELRTLHIHDYKHGAGVVVEVQHNKQTMGYACGALEELQLWDKVDRVVLHIHQPRGFHSSGPHRHWSISVAELEQWMLGEMIPAMDRALVSRDTASGEHCRFCPARFRACPQLMADMDELEEMMKEMTGTDPARELTNEEVGRFLDLLALAKIKGKAANTTAFNRMQAGAEVPGYKLAKSKVNRAWKDGADVAAREQFGLSAMSLPELLSPAQLEALPQGEDFVARWAFKPDAGLTVVRAEDSRAGVSRDTKSMFVAATKARKGK